jgi:hypothetical protein
MSHDVFISHSSADKRAADAACAVLEARGIKCWIAPRDLRPDSDWGESIITAIEQSRIMLLLLSTQANSSPQIRREVERAVNRSKTPLLTFVTGSHIVFVYTPGTLEFSSDRTYFLHLTRIQTGTLKAANGVYTLTSGLLSAQGNYRFEGSDQFVDTQSGTTAVWKRH